MYMLVKISSIGRQSEVATDFEPDGLIAAGKAMQKKFPKDQFGEVDEFVLSRNRNKCKIYSTITHF